MPTAEEITRHHDDRPPPGADPFVDPSGARPYEIRVVEYDDRWPADFRRVAERIRAVLGDRALEIHHVGSTSVPGLPAKPVIDIDLVVADPAEEAAYLPDLVAAGFVHHIREPWWHEHRLVKWADPLAYVHIFGPDCPEVIRHRMFHDWLVEHEEERQRYADAKRAAATAMNARPGGGTGMDYNRHKEPVVREIYDRMFRAHGLLP
ncbi:MAG TPA: GrpB family protein [Nocardioides sp.]|uniref:GrpB family protein n=1 Tax=Nocardioides sp. TaxID=35761 RepID=UPI002F42AFFC